MEPWTLENGVPRREIRTFPTYSSLWVNGGPKAAEAARNIRAVYVDNAIVESTARKWFSCFKEDSFDISNTPRSGIPSGFVEDQLNSLIHNDPHQCTRQLANVMNCDRSTIIQCLYSMGKVQKSGVWVPHALSQNHKNQQVAICASLLACDWLACEQHRPFLSFIISGDEKWCLYVNIRKRKWLSLNKTKICWKCSNFSSWHSIF